WGDNGAETNFTAALLGLQLYGEMTYTGVYDPAALGERFRRCCGADPQAFLDLSLFNQVPGTKNSAPGDPVNVCKCMLYQDPRIQLCEADTAGLRMAEHFAMLEGRYARYAEENPAYELMFRSYAALARALALKCAWHEQAGEAVRSGDREKVGALATELPETIAAVDALRVIGRRLWESTNKPNGFELIDVRLGGVCARLSTAMEKARAFAAGEAEAIPELCEESLVCKRRPDGAIGCTNTMDEIATPGRIDY